MKFILPLFFLILISCTTVRERQTAKHTQPKFSMEEIQASWEKAMSKAEEHKILHDMEGSWKAEVMFWVQPGTPPQTSFADSTNRTILDGRFLVEEYKGSFEGKPFEGMGITGFDTILEKFTHYWIDNMGTGSIVSEGSYDAEEKTISMLGVVTDPVSKEKRDTASITHIIDKNNHIFEMYDLMPDGNRFKTLEIKYTRK